MSIQKISLEAAQKIRQYIKSALVLPNSENHPGSSLTPEQVDDLPEPESLDALGDLFKFASAPEETTYGPNDQGRWFISAINPGTAMMRLPGLTLKPGYRLVTYLYRQTNNGIGSSWALPEALSTTLQLEKALSKSGDAQHPPCPEGALADVMDAVEGDGSPSSFIVASILRRELMELGALGNRCDWTHHHLIGAVPTQMRWQWKSEEPKDLSPKVRVLPDGRAAVELFTCRAAPPVAIFRHIDQYSPGSYKGTCVSQAIAGV